jgi:hypothetical protein
MSTTKHLSRLRLNYPRSPDDEAKTLIALGYLRNPAVTIDELQAILLKHEIRLTRLAVGFFLRKFREDLHLLIAELLHPRFRVRLLEAGREALLVPPGCQHPAAPFFTPCWKPTTRSLLERSWRPPLCATARFASCCTKWPRPVRWCGSPMDATGPPQRRAQGTVYPANPAREGTATSDALWVPPRHAQEGRKTGWGSDRTASASLTIKPRHFIAP